MKFIGHLVMNGHIDATSLVFVFFVNAQIHITCCIIDFSLVDFIKPTTMYLKR